MQADGKIKVARALIREDEEKSRKREVEKAGHERVKIREAAKHLREQFEAGMPGDRAGEFRALEKMHKRIDQLLMNNATGQ